MISIPKLSSSLLLLAFLVLAVDARSTSPWNRRFPSPAATIPSTDTNRHYPGLMLPQIRGGDSSELPASSYSTLSSNSPLPTPSSHAIDEESDKTIPCISGGHILRAGKQQPENAADGNVKAAAGANATDVVVESFVTKEDKATKKILKRHKQIAKKLKVRIA